MIQIVCAECGSDSICRDASARWSTTEQCWVMSGEQDFMCCDDCGAEDNVKEIPFFTDSQKLAALKKLGLDFVYSKSTEGHVVASVKST
jgi:hypothetical protein